MKRLLFISLILFCGCEEPIRVKVINDFNDSLSAYDSSLVNHFPKLEVKDQLIYWGIRYPAATYAENYNGINLIIKFPKERIIEIISAANENAIKIQPLFDSCSNVINYKESTHIDSLFKLHKCKDTINVFPISNFEFTIKQEELSKDFYKSAIVYLLDAKKGKFLEDEYLSKNGVGLPASWKHGYSKGVMISEKENIAIYWLEVW